MTCILLLLVVFTVIKSFNSNITSVVEARNHDLPMVPFREDWYRSLDNKQHQEATDITSEGNFAEFLNIRRRKLKTNKKVTKKKEENVSSQEVKSHREVVKRKKKNKRKRKKKKTTATRRFIKTTVGDKDSNMTDSKEITSRGKPVDIIVHIKMGE